MRLRHLLLIPVVLAPLVGCDPITFGGAVVGGAAVINDRRTVGSLVDDQSIELKARSYITEEKVLAAQVRYDVTSYNGIVLVTGEAPRDELRTRISEIVRRVPKVRQVHNEMAIAEPNSRGDRANDAWITTKVKSKLLGDETADGVHVKVTTDNAIVYLMGLVTREQGNAATEIARYVEGVERVVKVFEYID